MALPDMVLAEQLLASAAISHDHQLLVRTALKGEITFDAVAEELIAQHVMQAEQEAYFAKKGAGKGKGFRQPPARQFQVTGSLSLEERRAKVAALKARTTCRRCGARGHWSGDPTCPHTKGGKKGKGPSSPPPPMTSSSTTTSLRSSFGGPLKGQASLALSTSP